jgi:hypothetical protein
MASWRLAKSLTKLRDQFNQKYPKRNKSSDGTIGDAAHASRKSDHNPWVKDGSMGVVTAIDITNDPKSGCDVHAIAEIMRQKRDPRIKYVISNGRIFSSTTSPWQWRTYTGSNPHRAHFHVSVHSDKKHYDSEKVWDSGEKLPGNPQAPKPDPDIDSPKNRPTLRRGSKGELVKEVQTLVYAKVDGDFGPQTEGAVKSFQSRRDLKPDGIVGPLTWAALDKIEQRHDGEKEGDALEDQTAPTAAAATSPIQEY